MEKRENDKRGTIKIDDMYEKCVDERVKNISRSFLKKDEGSS